MKTNKFKTLIAIITILTIVTGIFTGCTEANRVSHNLSKEAENFNVIRRLTVMNARSDNVMLEIEAAFSIEVDSVDNQLEVTCEVDDNKYKKHFIGLNEWTLYVVEDVSGADVDKYHYVVNYLPEGNIIPIDVKEND